MLLRGGMLTNIKLKELLELEFPEQCSCFKIRSSTRESAKANFLSNITENLAAHDGDQDRCVISSNWP
jgi:hypothetical protein